jgi:HK97 family phage portal protein
MSKWRNVVQRVWPWAAKAGSYGIQELYAELLGRAGGSTKSGAQVNTQTALEVTAVLACVRVIAEGVAQVPFRVMRDEPRGDELPPRKIPVANHPLTRLFAVEPNEWMTAYEFRETLAMHAALIGNAYAFIVRGVGGKVIELLPLEPHTVQVERDGWNVVYKVTFPTGESRIVPPENMWHWKGPSWNTYSGLKAVHQAREAIGLAMTAEELQGKSFANGARPSGILSTVAALTEEQIKEIRSNWETAYGGAANSFKTAIMYGDWKFTPTSSTNQDTQLLQTRQAQIEEICRAFRVMPIMIGYQGDKSSTYASAEQMFLAHIVHTLMPWYARIEQSAAKALLTPVERERGMYFKHFAQGMMRGSMTERVAYYTSMYNMAAISPNEIRALEDMNPHEDGDDFVAPMNMAKPGEQVPPDPGAAPNRPGGPSGAAGSAQQRRTAGEGKHLGFDSPRSNHAEPSVLRGAADSAQKQLLNANAAAQVALANLMVKAAAWREEDHPRDEAGRFTDAGGSNKGSAADAFEPQEIESNRYVQWKSREKLIEMPIDTFLLLAKPGQSDDKEQGVRELRAAGTRFSTLPFLQFWGEGEERKIDGHEGRHRARQLKSEGYTTMPVLLRGDIRWSEQNDESRFDYREGWPKTLRSETGEHNLPFPVPREQAGWPYNGDGRLKDDGKKGKEWREEDHPRAPAGSENGGEFVAVGEGGANLSEADRERLRALKVPPGWTNVRLNPDPEGAVQVRGRDAKGRAVSIRRAEADEAAAAEKYARLQEFTQAVPKISEGVNAKLADPNVTGRERDTAAVLKLIEHTGFRVGGEGDTGAEKQAYGASTLRKEHVRVEGDTVHFAFTGKKGVSIEKVLHHPQIARIIEDRLKNATGDRLFNTSDSHVIVMLRELSGNDSFKTKDFRTWNGTSKAVEVIATMSKPTSKKEYDRAVLAVSKAVAAHLGNTPAVARASYINPQVWSVWQRDF